MVGILPDHARAAKAKLRGALLYELVLATFSTGTLQFNAMIEPGEKLLVASCPEFPEANGQGRTREEALQDLAASIRSVLEFRLAEALAQASPQAERTVVRVAA